MAQEVFVRGLTRRKTRASNNASMGTVAARVDLDNGPTRRVFSNKSTTAVVLPDVVAVLQKAGALATGTTTTGMVFRAPRGMKVWGVAAQVGTAPATQSIILDVKKAATPTAAGTTIFTDQNRRPTIAASGDSSTLGGTANAGYPGTATGVTADLNAGDYLRVEIAQVGTGTTGSDLSVQIFGY